MLATENVTAEAIEAIPADLDLFEEIDRLKTERKAVILALLKDVLQLVRRKHSQPDHQQAQQNVFFAALPSPLLLFKRPKNVVGSRIAQTNGFGSERIPDGFSRRRLAVVQKYSLLLEPPAPRSPGNRQAEPYLFCWFRKGRSIQPFRMILIL